MTFFTQYHYINIALIAAFLVSGGMLLWPMLNRTRSGLSTANATQLINRRNAAVIDLRDAEAFAKGHLPTARRVDAGELSTKISQLVKNKKTPLLLVCQNGQRSARALKAIQNVGFEDVCVLSGGMNAWQQASLPVVKEARETREVKEAKEVKEPKDAQGSTTEETQK